MNIEHAWLFIKYEYRACMIMHINDAWLFHKDMNIELHACFINIEMHDWSWDMNVGMHDYLIVICFYKIRLCFITICIPGLGIVFIIYIVVPIFIGMLSISWVQILRDDIKTDIRLI